MSNQLLGLYALGNIQLKAPLDEVFARFRYLPFEFAQLVRDIDFVKSILWMSTGEEDENGDPQSPDVSCFRIALGLL
jgi:hypothetical protein